MHDLRAAAWFLAEVPNLPFVFSLTGVAGGDSRRAQVELVEEAQVLTDPVADMLTRIRNGTRAGHASVEMPSSKIKVAIAEVLREEGFIRGLDVIGAGPRKRLRVLLAYSPTRESRLLGLRRISKPGGRVYVPTDRVPRVWGGIGVAILSTPRGVMTGERARREKVGGEVLAYVW